FPQTIRERRLLQEQMCAVANFDFGRSGKGGARFDQIGRIEHARAVFALITASTLITAMRTSPDHVAIRQEASVGAGVDLARRANFEVAVAPQAAREFLRQTAILFA